MPPPISQSIVFTYTDDLAVGSRFFGEVLELELAVDQGPCHIYRLTGSSYIGVCTLPDRPREKSAVTITLVTDDVDGWCEYLLAKGVECVSEARHRAAFGVYSALFMAPHGYRVEIQRFDDPSWHRRDELR